MKYQIHFKSINRRVINVDIFLFNISIYFLISYCSILYEPLRYFKYIFLIFPFLFWNQRNKNRNQILGEIYSRNYVKYFLKLYAIIFLVFFVVQIILGSISIRFFANFLFVILPLFCVYFLIPFINKQKIEYYFRFISIFTIIGYAIEKGSEFREIVLNPTRLFYAVLDSSVSSESHIYPFLLAFLFIFSYYYKFSWKYSLVLFLFILLAFKRVVLGGLLIFIALKIFGLNYKLIKSYSTLNSILFSFGALLLIVVYYFIATGYFDQYLFEEYGLYTNALLMGRQELYHLAISNSKNLFIGSGIGSIDNLLLNNKGEIKNITNLHSELLRMFLETGIFFYTIWIYNFFKNSLVTQFSLYIFLFLLILLLTDNVFIYFDAMFYFYLIVIFSIYKEK